MSLSKIEKFKVGFNHRRDTYTTKLGFINPLVSEATPKKSEKYQLGKSYDNWRDEKIDEEFYDNEPLSGFVLNYRVGGQSYGWSGREPKFRVLDPRGFEIEITLDNLVDLTEFGMGKGKVFEGELIYIYYNGRLTLINTEDSRYKNLYLKDKTDIKYDNEDFVVGGIYQTTEIGSESGFNLYLGAFIDFKAVKGKNRNIGTLKKIHYFARFHPNDVANIRNEKISINTYMLTENLSKSKIKYFHGVNEKSINKKEILFTIFKNASDVSIPQYHKLYYRQKANAKLGLIGDDAILPNNSQFKYVEFNTEKSTLYADISGLKNFVQYNNENYINFYQIGDKRYIAAEFYKSIAYKEHCEQLNVIQELPNVKDMLSEYFKNGYSFPLFKIDYVEDGIHGLQYQGSISEEILPYSHKLTYVTFKGKNITSKMIKLNETDRAI